MADDDIVYRLMTWADPTELIDEAIAEIERLRAVGDALVDAMKDRTHRSRSKSIQAWKEARRG